MWFLKDCRRPRLHVIFVEKKKKKHKRRQFVKRNSSQETAHIILFAVVLNVN